MSRNHNPDLLAAQDENEGDEAEEEKGGYEDDDEDEDEDEEDDEDNYSAPMFDQVTSPPIGVLEPFLSQFVSSSPTLNQL
jgi:hypothetical protein